MMKYIKKLIVAIVFVQVFILTSAQESIKQELHNELKAWRWAKVIYKGDAAEIQDLANSGIYDMNAKVFYAGVTPLYIAWKNSHQDVIQVLINAGADINAQDEYGDTLLHKAITNRFDGEEYKEYAKQHFPCTSREHPDLFYHILIVDHSWVGSMIPFLLTQEKVDVTIPNLKGITALDLALAEQNKNRNAKIYELIMQSGVMNNNEAQNSHIEEQAK